jgi:hypothetical protein
MVRSNHSWRWCSVLPSSIRVPRTPASSSPLRTRLHTRCRWGSIALQVWARWVSVHSLAVATQGALTAPNAVPPTIDLLLSRLLFLSGRPLP